MPFLCSSAFHLSHFFIFQDCLDSLSFLGEMLSKFQIGSGDQQSKHMLNYSNLLKSKSNPIVASVVCQNDNAEFVLRKYQVYLSTKISGHMNSVVSNQCVKHIHFLFQTGIRILFACQIKTSLQALTSTLTFFDLLKSRQMYICSSPENLLHAKLYFTLKIIKAHMMLDHPMNNASS